MQYEGVDIDVVPEATLAGWAETKLSSNRAQDRADVVQVMKKTPPAALGKTRTQIDKVHRLCVRRFDELYAVAQAEQDQERDRGGPR